MADRTLEIKITGDSSSLSKALGSAGKDADSFGTKVSGHASGALKGLGIAAAGAAAGGLLVLGKGLVDGVKTAIEHEKALKQTDAVIKSTGGSAGVTAGHVLDLSDKIEKMSGIDDLNVQAGENMLLTFTNIKNGVGAGNQIFDKATNTLADMATATGQAMPKAAVMLGKALNDPIKGVSALARVGVTFTQGQKDSIKAMVAHGNTAGAQKIILGELQKEFGGSAKAAGTTMAGQVKILQAHLEDLEQEIGEKVLPILNRLVAWAIAHWPEFQKYAEIAMQKISEAWDKDLHPALEQIMKVITVLVNFVQDNWGTISKIIEGAMKVIQGIINVVMGVITGDWGRAWNGIKQIFDGTFQAITGSLQLAVAALSAIASAVGTGILNAITGALGGLASAVGNLITGTGTAITGAATAVVSAATTLATSVLNAIVNTITGIGAKIGTLIGEITTAITTAITGAVTAAGNFGKGVVDGIITAVTGIGAKVVALVDAVVTGVAGLVDNATNAATRVGSGIVSGAVGAVTGIGGKVVGIVNDIVSGVIDLVDNAGNAATRVGARIVSGALAGVAGIGAKVLGVVNNIIDEVNQVAQDVWSAAERIGERIISGVLSGLSGLFNSVKNAITGAVGSAISAAGGVLHGSGPFMFTIHTVGKPLAAGVVQGFNEGMQELAPAVVSSVGGGIAGPKTVTPLTASAGAGHSRGPIEIHIHNHGELDENAIVEKISYLLGAA